jgi:y4mF family transcriptional regulator
MSVCPNGNTDAFLSEFRPNIPDREKKRTFSTRSSTILPIGNVAMTSQEIGAVVRQVRLAHGLRQDQVAAVAGVGLRFLVELERGKPTVRLDKVLAVLSALGCRLDITPPPAPSGSDV